MESAAERISDETAVHTEAPHRFMLDDEGSAPASAGGWTPEGETLPSPGSSLDTTLGTTLGTALAEDAIIAAIATVYDPEIPVNIYELGLIYAVDLHEDGRVKVEMTLTAPGCPSAQELPVQVRDAVMTVAGVVSCDVETVWEPAWDASRMSEDARLALNMF